MAEPPLMGRFAFDPQGLGIPRAFPVTPPAAGAEIALQVPSRVLWRILGLVGTFTASADVATRTINTRLRKDGFTFWQSPVPTTVTASQVATLILSTANFVGTAALTNDVVGLPFDCYLGERMRLETLTTNIQAADVWSGIDVWVMEWKEL